MRERGGHFRPPAVDPAFVVWNTLEQNPGLWFLKKLRLLNRTSLAKGVLGLLGQFASVSKKTTAAAANIIEGNERP